MLERPPECQRDLLVVDRTDPKHPREASVTWEKVRAPPVSRPISGTDIIESVKGEFVSRSRDGRMRATPKASLAAFAVVLGCGGAVAPKPAEIDKGGARAYDAGPKTAAFEASLRPPAQGRGAVMSALK